MPIVQVTRKAETSLMVLRINSPSTTTDRIALERLFNDTIPSYSEKFRIPEDFTFEPPHSHLNYRISQGKYNGVTVAGIVDRMPEAVLRTENRTQENWMKGYKIREIVLISVAGKFRRNKMGSELLQTVEESCVAAKVEVLFGVVDDSANKDELEAFYRAAGFAISKELPLFFGCQWHTPLTPVEFYFYKQLPIK